MSWITKWIERILNVFACASVVGWVVLGIAWAKARYDEGPYLDGYRRGIAHGCAYMKLKGTRPPEAWIRENWRMANTDDHWILP